MINTIIVALALCIIEILVIVVARFKAIYPKEDEDSEMADYDCR